jgi:hypothetical protein
MRSVAVLYQADALLRAGSGDLVEPDGDRLIKLVKMIGKAG